jgi:CheY-like chemotaxis protein
MSLESITFDLRAMVGDVARLLGLQAHEKGIELACFVEPEVPVFVGGDPSRLRQVLTNLVGNGIKFTDHGEVVIRVVLDHESAKHALLRFEIKDTGIGIHDEDRTRLFHSFVQMDSSTTRKYGGTGLGLAISKELAALMGGQIGVESELGKGSTFWFTVRLEKRACQELAGPRDIEHLRGRRILCVDDHETNRLVLAQQLGNTGVHASCVGGSREALAALRAGARGGEPFDVAIVDGDMPGIDGFQLAEMVREDRGLGSVRLVLFSSVGERYGPEMLRAKGFAGWLEKPARQSQILACLTRVLSDGDTRPEKPEAALPGPAAGTPARWVRVLLAEDIPVNQAVAVRMLEKLGCRVEVAGNGQEALQAWTEDEYDLIFMDCQMPVLDGYAATRSIREREEGTGRRTPIIAMTAHAMKGDREKCLEAGMDDYMSKPIKRPQLEEKIQQWAPEKADLPPAC